MPLYEFRCRGCSERLEKLWRNFNPPDSIKCTECGSEDTETCCTGEYSPCSTYEGTTGYICPIGLQIKSSEFCFSRNLTGADLGRVWAEYHAEI